MKILTGKIAPTSGTIFLGGFDLFQNQNKIKSLIGYCPQFDALLDLLTVEEHLELYAKIKGIRRSQITDQINKKIKQLDLENFRNKLSKSLSGGNKRKLSVAIALLGIYLLFSILKILI